MSDRTFVDTNVLVYAHDSAFPEKQSRAWERLDELWHTRTGRISVQVCNEYFVTVTRKLKPGRPEDLAWKDLLQYQAWEPVTLDFRLLERARETQVRYGLSWWDSTIVAAAYAAECTVLLSEDLSEGQEYWGIRVENPFGL